MTLVSPAMRAPLRNALLGGAALALLAMLTAGTTLLGDAARPSAAESPGATLPPGGGSPAAAGGVLPEQSAPEPPRLAEGPDYDACLAQLRMDPEGAIARATAWEARGGGEGARHCLALGLLAAGDAPRGAERLERLAAASQAPAAIRASVYAQAAQAWMLAAQPDRSYGAVTLALSLVPGDAALLVDRAVAAAGLGRNAEALIDLDQAIRQDGARVEPWVFRAAALRRLDRPDEAMRDVQRALAMEPGNAEAMLERGILKQLKGDTAGARRDWQQVVRLAPDSAAADLAAQNLALNEAGPRRR
ncbi:tetratricopeptide repeat protein [Pseudoroseomonas globiformis]|uniref:Tetratricopeptide repeat protein n=1 Tax=Teichococcus globiformis TaxID=2307229 RepID=A0ABV7G2U8_9PROT